MAIKLMRWEIILDFLKKWTNTLVPTLPEFKRNIQDATVHQKNQHPKLK